MLTSLLSLGLVFMNAIFSPNHRFVLHGKVVDNSGQPIAGVQIDGQLSYDSNVIHIPVAFTGRIRHAPITATTNENGEFTISTSGTALIVHFIKPGFHQDAPANSDPYTFLINRSANEHGTANAPVVFKMLPGEEWKPN